MKSIGMIFGVMFIMLIFSCTPKSQATPQYTKDTVNAEKVWNYISKEAPYKNYDSWPNHSGFELGKSPHGVYHKEYINKILLNALPIASQIAPSGSVIVKENYDADKELVAITVMAKIDENNTNAANWFWAEYSPEGRHSSVSQDFCIKCHIAYQSNDFVILSKLNTK